MNHWKYPPQPRDNRWSLATPLICIALGGAVWIFAGIGVATVAGKLGDMATPQHYECPTKGC